MKQAIITGAGAGLGAEIAEQLCAAGYRVGVLDVNEENAIAVAESLKNAVPLVADVTEEESVARAFTAFGETPDLLVNNAGIVRFGAFEEQSVEDFRLTLNINLLGPCICSREVAKGMLERGSGNIVHITSVNGLHPSPGIGLYGPTKSALSNLTQVMANEWGPRGIRVNAVAPGFIDAGMSKPIYADPKVRKVRGSGVPLRRLGEASDIASAILYLASDEANYINGHELVVDGGVINSIFMQLPRS